MLEQIKPALIITRREIRDQFRDWRIIVPILVLTLIFPSIMNFTAGQVVDFVERYNASIVGERLIPFLLMVVGFFPISVSMVIALESFVGEKERGSIEPLLSSPLTDGQLYLGKLLAVTVPPLFASYLGIAVYLIGVRRQIGWVPDSGLLIQILILTLVQALVMVAGAVVVSSQTTSVRAANLLASFIIIPMAFVIQGESVVMFWDKDTRFITLWWVITGMIILAVVLVRMGVSHFSREELLGTEMDTINVKGSWQFFRDSFKGHASSVGEWYHHEIPATLRRLRPAILIATLMLAFGMKVGIDQAQAFPLPPEFLDLQNFEIETFTRFEAIEFMSARGVASIFVQNARVGLISFLFGAISFSVFGILLLMIPFALIGYFIATFAGAGVAPLDFMLGLILPHGIFEIPAIVLMGAGMFYMGVKVITPSDGKSIGQSFLSGAAEWARLYVGVILPLLAVAALLEAYLTPVAAVFFLGR